MGVALLSLRLSASQAHPSFTASLVRLPLALVIDLGIPDVHRRAHPLYLARSPFNPSEPATEHLISVRTCKASFPRTRPHWTGSSKETSAKSRQRARPDLLLVKHFVSASPIHNLGLFAVGPIKKGQEVWRFEPDYDVEIPAAMLADLDEDDREVVRNCAEYIPDRNVYRLGNDGDIFMNHSDQPSLLDLGDQMIAAWDIAAGEELTCDYRTVHVDGYRPHPKLGATHRPT